ncbi:S1 family peptidase [Kitasatospora sp. DSM 101779]|uniref:S1 family peptidase n=1 Tax=Kitasatospora sp. DSM 101779 TaxID=2853165 RepID=UPI0021D8E7BF|nr:S1 family peptidase [Kitasatospora sp. DSM 101779]MCU7821070.1 S1 family peptidase [Kitasatospora sp. DSM 101779]
MRHVNGVRAVLPALLALTSLGFGLSPATAAPDTAPAASTVRTTPAPGPGLVDALRRDLGLTRDQALTRLDQEATAARLLPRVRDLAGSAYGGAWFDPAQGRLVVGLTDPARAAAVRAAGAATTSVARTEAALDRAKAAVDTVSRNRRAPAAVTGWRVDPRRNAVVVSVAAGARADSGVNAFLDAAAAAGPVTVEETAEHGPRTLSAGVVGGDPYYINGNTRCSIGFAVQGGFVSAGHCGRAGSSVVGWDGSAMGSFVDSSFPGNDYSYIRIGNGWWTVPVVLGWGTVSDVLVRGSWQAPVGSSVCRSGSTTHWHCGSVLGLDETVNYSQGAVYQLTRTSVCAEPGDSGGSFVTGDQAQGVTSGGWGNCSSGGQTWFQPVNEILSRYGLTLVTA